MSITKSVKVPQAIHDYFALHKEIAFSRLASMLIDEFVNPIELFSIDANLTLKFTNHPEEFMVKKIRVWSNKQISFKRTLHDSHESFEPIECLEGITNGT